MNKMQNFFEGNERRKSERLNIGIKVEVKRPKYTKNPVQAVTSDISESGLRLNMDEPLLKSYKIDLLLYFPNDKKPIKTSSRVVWCNKVNGKDGKDVFQVGFKHLKISKGDKSRFILMYCEAMMNYYVLDEKSCEGVMAS